MKNFKLLLFALTLMFSVSAIAAPTSDKAPKAKKEHKTTAEKKDKKFVDDAFFTFSGGVITNPTRWAIASSSLCPSGVAQLCGISFDSSKPGYALDANGKPNSNILTEVDNNIASIIAAGNHTGTISYNGSTITVYLKPAA